MSQNVIECTEYAVNEKQNILKRKKIISKTYLNFYNCFQIHRKSSDKTSGPRKIYHTR